MTHFLSRPEGRIAYEDQGEGPLVVLVPGMGDTRGQHRHLTPLLLARGARVLTVDLRGLGESDVGFSAYGAREVGEDIAALLDAVQAEGALLVGNSMAAAAVLWAAAARPARVAGAALLGPVVRDLPMNPVMAWAFRLLLAGPWGRHAWGWWYGQIHKGGLPDDHAAHVAAIKANLAEPGRMAAFRAMASASKAPVEPCFAAVRAPVTVIMGAADPDFPDAAAEARHVAALFGGQPVILPGVGHYPHVERPAETAALIAQMIAWGTPCRAQA